MQLPIKIELNFDEEFINLLKELKPKRGGIYAKVYKELLNDIIATYYHLRKGMEAKPIVRESSRYLMPYDEMLKRDIEILKLVGDGEERCECCDNYDDKNHICKESNSTATPYHLCDFQYHSQRVRNIVCSVDAKYQKLIGDEDKIEGDKNGRIL